MTIKPLTAARICCLLVLSLLAHAAVSASEPAFWKVTRGKATVYLLGSMHFGRPEFFPLPKQVESAYQSADVLAVEVDMSAVNAAMASSAITRYGRLSAGKTLEQILSAKVYADLTKKAIKAGLALSVLEPYQPWFAAVQLIAAEIKKTPLQQELGIDLYFINKNAKPVEQIESLEQQLGIFGGLTMSEQERFLKQTLDDMDNSRAYLTTMASAWQRGDTEQLERTLINPFKEDTGTRELFNKVFTERNYRMAEAAEKYLSEERHVFMVVGVGHMLGEQGIVALLRKGGAEVERIQFPQ